MMLRPQAGFDADAARTTQTGPAARTPLPHQPDDEHQLAGYLRLLWSRRRLLAVLTVLGGAIGLSASLLATRTYEAQLILSVNQSKLEQEGQAQPADTLLGNAKSILTSQSIVRSIVREFSLDDEPHEVTPDRFLLRAISIEAIPTTTLLDLRVRLGNAKLAADVANRMAERAVEISKGLTVEEAIRVRDSMATQVEESRENLDQITQALENAKKQAQVELQEKDIEALLEQRAELRRLVIETAGARAALEKTEQELGARERVQTLNRSIDSDPALTEAARSAGADNILGLTLRDEEVNPTYDKLDEEVALARTRVTDLERRLAQLTKQHDLDASSLPLLSKLYESQGRIARLETDLEIARQVYVDVATRYQQARVQVASRSAQLLVVDEATPPIRPVARHVLRNLALGAVVGLLLAMVYVLGSQALGAVRQPSSV